MIARQLFYEGRVQGVGFRYTCKQMARGYDVTGWVRNLPDGRVELQCAGERDEVEDFLAAIAESELKSHIKSVIALPIPPLVGVRGFEILP
jgi:acylphosphatase